MTCAITARAALKEWHGSGSEESAYLSTLLRRRVHLWYVIVFVSDKVTVVQTIFVQLGVQLSFIIILTATVANALTLL